MHSLLRETETYPPLWWMYQGVTVIVDITIISAFNMSPISLVCFINILLYNIMDMMCIQLNKKRFERWINNIFNVIMASLFLAHTIEYDAKPYYLLVALHVLPILQYLYDKVAFRTRVIPSVRGFLSGIRHRSFYTQTNSKPEVECCICLEQLTSNVVSLQCSHSFHRWCIREWNSINANCPLCRTVLV